MREISCILDTMIDEIPFIPGVIIAVVATLAVIIVEIRSRS